MQLKVPTRTTGEDIFALLVVLVGLKVSTSSSAAKMPNSTTSKAISGLLVVLVHTKMPTITTSGCHINKEGRKILKP